MSCKAINFKLEEKKIKEVKDVANVFHLTMTDIVNVALDEYLAKIKQDPLYRLTCNVEEASKEESEEIISAINSLTDDDLKITTKKKVTI